MTEKYPNFIEVLNLTLENSNDEIFVFAEILIKQLSILESVVRNIDRRVEDIEKNYMQ